MPHKACLEPGCGSYSSYRGRCQAHAKQQDKSINRSGLKVYSSRRWKLLRRHKLGINPICEKCQAQLAEHVHHKHGVETDPWSLQGLEALCVSCHSKATRAEQIARTT